MKTHELRCHREPFQAVLDQQKRHEVRVNDRGFQVGDTLDLREWDDRYVADNGDVKPPGTVGASLKGYTGRTARVRVTYVTAGGTWGLPTNLCVMSIVVESTGQPCANYSPSWFAGRWRDWHRGHGCDRDDGKPRSDAGGIDASQLFAAARPKR